MNSSGYAALMFQEVAPVSQEHWINTLSAWATGSRFCHVELALGNTGETMWVLRIYNDHNGAEFVRRTGLNPSLKYITIPCTKQQEARMIHFAQWAAGQNGNRPLPFSKLAMIRAGIGIPRRTPETPQNVFCAELVARALQVGQKISIDSNPGAATPQVLWNMFSKSGALTGNPVVLNQIMQSQNRNARTIKELAIASGAREASARVSKTSYPVQEREPLTRPRPARAENATRFFSGNFEMQDAYKQATIQKPTLRMLSQCSSV